jgi:hypothetical protein
MAMKFGDATLNDVVENHFRPAVARAGFNLRLLTDEQPAGLIDDQLRAAILGSRFLISDLTHGNQGAYWEAGFAEGLGLPVVYTCSKMQQSEVGRIQNSLRYKSYGHHHLGPGGLAKSTPRIDCNDSSNTESRSQAE